MKIIFISTTLAIIYQMRYARMIRGSYKEDRDTFRYEFLIGASIIIALFVHERIADRGPIHWLMKVRPAFRKSTLTLCLAAPCLQHMHMCAHCMAVDRRRLLALHRSALSRGLR